MLYALVIQDQGSGPGSAAHDEARKTMAMDQVSEYLHRGGGGNSGKLVGTELVWPS